MREQIRAARESDGGFTLIELLIVIVILGVLAGIVVFGVAQFQSDSERAACRADLKTVQVAADAYDATNGRYPVNMGELLAPKKFLSEAPAEGDYTFVSGTKTVTRDPVCPPA